MREGIHPDYPAAAVNCACGNTFVTRSTRGDFQVDVCAACHPFYTGTQKLIDAAGRVDRFRKRYDKTQAAQAGIAATNKAKADAAPKVEAAPKAEAAPKKEKAAKAEAAPAPEAEKSTEPEQTNTPE